MVARFLGDVGILYYYLGSMLIPMAGGVPQNLTEHSWIYSQGYIDDTRIYQTEAGFHGQKLVTGTRGTGTVSRSIYAQVYGGFPDGYNETRGDGMGRVPE